MDKLVAYQKILRHLLQRQVTDAKSHLPNSFVQLVTDDENGHYMLVHNGWVQNKRNYGCFLHLSLRNHKVYVEHDGTDNGFAQELLQAGIPKEDIVLAFQSPAKRIYSGFATT
jgi:XisI protein